MTYSANSGELLQVERHCARSSPHARLNRTGTQSLHSPTRRSRSSSPTTIFANVREASMCAANSAVTSRAPSTADRPGPRVQRAPRGRAPRRARWCPLPPGRRWRAGRTCSTRTSRRCPAGPACPSRSIPSVACPDGGSRPACGRPSCRYRVPRADQKHGLLSSSTRPAVSGRLPFADRDEAARRHRALVDRNGVIVFGSRWMKSKMPWPPGSRPVMKEDHATGLWGGIDVPSG